jgi:hypothetical protein
LNSLDVFVEDFEDAFDILVGDVVSVDTGDGDKCGDLEFECGE